MEAQWRISPLLMIADERLHTIRKARGKSDDGDGISVDVGRNCRLSMHFYVEYRYQRSGKVTYVTIMPLGKVTQETDRPNAYGCVGALHEMACLGILLV
jgi:hypothetical protein